MCTVNSMWTINCAKKPHWKGLSRPWLQLHCEYEIFWSDLAVFFSFVYYRREETQILIEKKRQKLNFNVIGLTLIATCLGLNIENVSGRDGLNVISSESWFEKVWRGKKKSNHYWNWTDDKVFKFSMMRRFSKYLIISHSNSIHRCKHASTHLLKATRAFWNCESSDTTNLKP